MCIRDRGTYCCSFSQPKVPAYIREMPATVSSFYVSVLYTAMLRTSTAAVVIGCFYFCPLDCDASVMVDCTAVGTGRMLEKYIPAERLQQNTCSFLFLVEVLLLLLLLLRAAAAYNISAEAKVSLFFFAGCAAADFHSSRGMC